MFIEIRKKLKHFYWVIAKSSFDISKSNQIWEITFGKLSSFYEINYQMILPIVLDIFHSFKFLRVHTLQKFHNLKCPRETLRNLPYFWNTKKHVLVYIFSSRI